MSVYVDPIQPAFKNRRWPYSRFCHMFADSLEELHAFAHGVLGLKRSWFQDHRVLPHYDLVPTKRKLAVRRGAIEVDLTYVKDCIDATKAGLSWPASPEPPNPV